MTDQNDAGSPGIAYEALGNVGGYFRPVIAPGVYRLEEDELRVRQILHSEPREAVVALRIITENKVISPDQHDAATLVSRIGIGFEVLPRCNFPELRGAQIVERMIQDVSTDAAQLAAFHRAKRGEAGCIVDCVVARIFALVPGPGLATGKEIEYPRGAFPVVAPAIVRSRVNLVEMDRELLGCVNRRPQDDSVARVLRALEMRIGAGILWYPLKRHGLPIRIAFCFFIRSALGGRPEEMLGDHGVVAR